MGLDEAKKQTDSLVPSSQGALLMKGRTRHLWLFKLEDAQKSFSIRIL
jgi:hypothetical protein